VSDFTLSAAMRSSITAMNNTSAQMALLQKRVATGRRVNSAMDDPSAFFTSVSLSSRAQDLLALTDNITTAKSTVDAANNAVSGIQSLLASARSIANQALQSTQELTTVEGNHGTAFTTSSVIATTGGSSTRLKAGDTITVGDGTTTATYTAANNDTVQTLLDAVNNTSNLKITASLNSDGQIQFDATSNVDITIGGTINGAGGGTLNGITGLTAGTTSYTTNTIRQSAALQFDNLLSQIDQAAQDATFNGVNLLTGGSLSVKFNETGTSTMSVSGATATSDGLGIAAASNTFQLDTDITAALDDITAALTSLQSISINLGSQAAVVSARNDFNKGLIDILNAGAENLVSNDMNEDSAALLALQTRQQLAATSISLAQGQDSSVLRILGIG
jgi:flagellin-like hook-associated protein FlgL